jgi:hypothetical protein
MRRPAGIVFCLLLLALASCTARQSENTTAGPSPSVAPVVASPVPEVSTRRNSAVIGKNAVDPKDLALPLYPGAIQAETGALLLHSKNGVSRVMSLSTQDDFEKVYRWYKQRMPAGSEQAHMAVPNGSVASFLIGRAQDPDTRSVLITQNRDKTSILLTRQSKSGK